MPYTHGVEAQDDQLTVDPHFRELLPAPEFGRHLAGACIVVSLDKEDVFEVPGEIENLALLDLRVHAIQDRGIHFRQSLERTTAGG